MPIYKQIAQHLDEMITRGELRLGDPIPSEASIESTYHVSRTTARRVVRELRVRGLVTTVQGEGSFVGCEGTPRNQGRRPLYMRLAAEVAQRIRQGELQPNRPIPSEKTLMQQYGIAKATARQVVAALRHQGWVFTVPYRGSYVSPENEWPAPGQ
ncbi:GntR family transcriptional regulator [Nonomuraea sp. NPDC050663]|uniref:GntR family transcriptional regulator n=1 Tax=Nonomuraea sp. NPDC050663 TaxID=3364370 RepID=UPI0037984F5B